MPALVVSQSFVAEDTVRQGLAPNGGWFELQRRLGRSTRTLMGTTVETFISDYTATIQEQNERMQTFNRWRRTSCALMWAHCASPRQS